MPVQMRALDDETFLNGLPGVLPSRQQRSRKTTEALLLAGEKLLRTRRLEEVSIADLAASVGVTVGSFYGRFESKDAYFNALQALAIRRARLRHGALRAQAGDAPLELAQVCRALAGSAAAWFRDNEGVVRAALTYDSHAQRWTPFKELGRDFRASSTPTLLACLGPGRRAAKTRAIGFAFQALFGILINIVLNNPGPCGLGDRDLVPRLAALIEATLRAEMAAARGAVEAP
jgi:AcrR family transcriptional regulator